MENGVAVIGGFITVAFGVIGWFFNRLNTSVQSSIKYIKDDVTECADKSSHSVTTLKVDTSKAICGLSERLDKDIENLRETVVFSDVFEQHEKLEDSRHEYVQQMQDMIKEQVKAASTQNAAEHDRICGKMDAIPQIIRDEILSISRLKNG